MSEEQQPLGYHYWHASVPKEAPPPQHTLLAVQPVSSDSRPVVGIDQFAFMVRFTQCSRSQLLSHPSPA